MSPGNDNQVDWTAATTPGEGVVQSLARQARPRAEPKSKRNVMDTLHRDFQKTDFPQNVLIVTHGLTMRLFLMRWFHWTVSEFEALRQLAPDDSALASR